MSIRLTEAALYGPFFVERVCRLIESPCGFRDEVSSRGVFAPCPCVAGSIHAR